MLSLSLASYTKEVTTFHGLPSEIAMKTKSPEMLSQRSDSSMTKETKMLPIPAAKLRTAMLPVAMTKETKMLPIPAAKLRTAMLPFPAV